MAVWVQIGLYVLSLVSNIIFLSYFAGRHTRKVDELAEWKKDHAVEFDKMSREVAYLSGRLNGGVYKHKD